MFPCALPLGGKERDRERERERAPCQADNTPAEQKNQWLMIFSSWLVACGRAASVSTEYFVVGHTHCKVDQRFSIIAGKLSASETLETPDDFLNL